MGYSIDQFFDDLLKKANADYNESQSKTEGKKEYKSVWDCFLEAYYHFDHDEYRQRCLIHLLLQKYAEKNSISIGSAATEIISLGEENVAVIMGDYNEFKLYGELPPMAELKISAGIREKNLKASE